MFKSICFAVGILFVMALVAIFISEQLVISIGYRSLRENIKTKTWGWMTVEQAKSEISRLAKAASRGEADYELGYSSFKVIKLISYAEDTYINASTFHLSKKYYAFHSRAEYAEYYHWLKQFSKKYFKNPDLILKAD